MFILRLGLVEQLGMRTCEHLCPQHNVTQHIVTFFSFKVWFWKGKEAFISLGRCQILLLKVPQTQGLIITSLKSTKQYSKWSKFETIEWGSVEQVIVVGPWSELADATLWLASLWSRSKEWAHNCGSAVDNSILVVLAVVYAAVFLQCLWIVCELSVTLLPFCVSTRNLKCCHI